VTCGNHPRVSSQRYTSCARAIEVRHLDSIAGAEGLAETDRQFSQARAGIRKALVDRGEDRDRAVMRTHTIAGKRLSLLSPESRMHAGEADIAKKHHWDRVTETA